MLPLRATEHEEALGMDVVEHGEEAYTSGEGAILVAPEARDGRRGGAGAVVVRRGAGRCA